MIIVTPLFSFIVDKSATPMQVPSVGSVEVGRLTFNAGGYALGGEELDFSARFAQMITVSLNQRSGIWPGRWEISNVAAAKMKVRFFRWGVAQSQGLGTGLALAEFAAGAALAPISFDYIALGIPLL